MVRRVYLHMGNHYVSLLMRLIKKFAHLQVNLLFGKTVIRIAPRPLPKCIPLLAINPIMNNLKPSRLFQWFRRENFKVIFVVFKKWVLHNGDIFSANVMMSHAVAWRGGCAAASVTSNRIGSIYLLGSFFCFITRRLSFDLVSEAHPFSSKRMKSFASEK